MSGQVRGWVAVVVGLVATASFAEKKTLILASGDCSDPGLVAGAKDFRDASARLLGPTLMESETVIDIVRPRALRSLQDIDRQLESARALFYGGQPERADEIADRVLEQLERASPENAVWNTLSQALVLKALIARNAEKAKDMNDAFRRILRVDPTFKLDPDAYPPSALAALDSVRKEVNRARKNAVLIRVESGPAAAVFIDGHNVGTTPFKAELISGSYRLSLATNGMVSFPRKIEVPRDQKVNVDFAFEGSVSVQPPLCLTEGSEKSAVKLAQLVTAEQVIILRNNARRGEPPYLSGALYTIATGTQERTGAVQAPLVANLATFIVTGKKTVEIGDVPPPPLLPPSDTPSLKEPAVVLSPQPVSGSTPALDPVAFKDNSGVRTVGWVLVGAGAAATIAGIVTFAVGGADRARLAAITTTPLSGQTQPPGLVPVGQTQSPEDKALTDRHVETVTKMDAVAANNTISGVLIGGGVGLVAAGILGVVLFPDSPAQVSVAPSKDGAMFGVSGQF